MKALLNELSLECRTELVNLLEEATSVGAWDWNIADNSFLWSPRQFEHFGLEPAQTGKVTYEDWLNAIHHDDRAAVQAAVADTIASGRELYITFRVLWRETAKDMIVSVHWLRARGRLVRDGDGAPLRMIGTCRDVTEEEEYKALEAARIDAGLAKHFRAKTRFDLFFDTSPEGLIQFQIEPDGRFTYQAVNAAGLDAVKLSMAAVRGLTPVEVMGADDGSKVVAALRHVAQTALPYHFQPTFQLGERAVTYDCTYMPVCNAQGIVTEIFARARDITEDRRVAADLRQTQKLESLGQMAAGLSGELQRMLTSLRGCFHRLNVMDPSPEMSLVVGLGEQSLRQSEVMAKQLLAFASKDRITPETVELGGCIDGALETLRRAVPEARITIASLKRPCEVLANATRIEACLLQLCANARDARPDGCRIVITAHCLNADDMPSTTLVPGAYACITVSDNGPAMPADILSRAIEPFFTTREPGHGAGLGLSAVYGTVRSFGGTVTIDSVEGEGTQVRLYLRRRTD